MTAMIDAMCGLMFMFGVLEESTTLLIASVVLAILARVLEGEE